MLSGGFSFLVLMYLIPHLLAALQFSTNAESMGATFGATVLQFALFGCEAFSNFLPLENAKVRSSHLV